MLNHLSELIRKHLPMPIDQFMAMALGHPKYGYYANHAAIGAEGDFITAPEISQLFGEIVGAWVVQQLEFLVASTASHQQVALAELGPGRGVLLNDILRVLTKLRPGLTSRVNLQLVEVNPTFKLMQQKIVQNYGLQAKWYNQVGALPEGPAVIIANEFFDALPIKQYIWQSGNWHERVVAAGEGGEFGFSTLQVPPHVATSLANWYPTSCEQGIIELSIAREESFKLLASQIAQHGGGLWVCDYGYYEPSYSSTLRSFYRHKVVNIFEKLGEADLTSDVDFGSFVKMTSNYPQLKCNLCTQGQWLDAYGGSKRAYKLTESNLQALDDYNKLTSEAEMGLKFKVLEVVS